MLKILLFAFLLLSSSVGFAVDLSLLDGQAKGKGCYDLEQYAYWVTKGSRDKNEDIRLTMQRLEAAYVSGKNSPLVHALGQPYFDELYQFMVDMTKEIWKFKDVPPKIFRGLTHDNCEAFDGHTEQFITFQTLLKLRAYPSQYYDK